MYTNIKYLICDYIIVSEMQRGINSLERIKKHDCPCFKYRILNLNRIRIFFFFIVSTT